MKAAGKVKEKIQKLKVKISSSSLKDILRTKNLSRDREKFIASSAESTADGTYAINRKARRLHPDRLTLEVKSVRDQGDGSAKTFVFSSPDGSPLPRFRAGQYLPIRMRIGESVLSRPYSICSSPADADRGEYEITVESFEGGFAGNYLCMNLKPGDLITSSGPGGTFYYERLRDGEDVLAVAGGSGVTPFVSMARALRDGTEKFRLTLIYGARNEGRIYYKKELDEIAAACPDFKVVYVLEEGGHFPFESGYVTADIIRKYMPDGKSAVYLCGSVRMKEFLRGELAEAGVPDGRIRAEGSPVGGNIRLQPDYPRGAGVPGRVAITVLQGTEERTVSADTGESVLVSLERAGIAAPSGCRSGECGWCRAKIVSGDVYVPASHDGQRRKIDRRTGYFHVCCAFPLTDLTVEIPPADTVF